MDYRPVRPLRGRPGPFSGPARPGLPAFLPGPVSRPSRPARSLGLPCPDGRWADRRADGPVNGRGQASEWAGGRSHALFRGVLSAQGCVIQVTSKKFWIREITGDAFPV
ncbi:hypothetical protein GCM10010269_27730 [Streptomyces humidus]|uniref:Uncharacterized protein n=1 Tax=Streptomyces humidus TaxID=52259 RepID=A0A918L2V3_9ACTN|nr:hypothetical protein GCM10010269_27730 [Streptomyces humidus]